jgi:hypothetical protein
VREEGPAALWKGITPRLMRIMPGQAITFMTYEFVRLVGRTTSPRRRHTRCRADTVVPFLQQAHWPDRSDNRGGLAARERRQSLRRPIIFGTQQCHSEHPGDASIKTFCGFDAKAERKSKWGGSAVYLCSSPHGDRHVTSPPDDTANRYLSVLYRRYIITRYSSPSWIFLY